MQHTFNSCTRLTEIDLSGLDPSSLEDLANTFGGCGSLVTIWADADWELPTSGMSGFKTFYQCSSLVAGRARSTRARARATSTGESTAWAARGAGRFNFILNACFFRNEKG